MRFRTFITRLCLGRRRPGRWRPVFMITNRLVCRLWAFVYRRWMDEGDVVVGVRGWRTALIDTKYGARQTRCPCFWMFR